MNIVKMEEYQRGGPPEERQMRYAVYSYEAQTPDGIAYTRSFIVIKNGFDVIVKFTRFHEYAGVYDRRTFLPISADPKKKLSYICMMLNYVLVEMGEAYNIKHVFDITKDMLTDFFEDYALSPKDDGSHRSKDTVERCISAVTGFMYALRKRFGNYVVLTGQMLYREQVVVTDRGKKVLKSIPDFHIKGIDEHRDTFRDLPTKAFELLLPMAFIYAPDIAFAMCIQAFAGLRAGEAMNVRQVSSPLGQGLIITSIAGRVKNVSIDLRHVYTLRSDGIKVGRIKKPRTQHVYQRFLDAFYVGYDFHMKRLANRPCEEKYRPMFINEDGMAMSYDSYRKKFESLVNNHLRPTLLESDDPEMRIYGQLLCEHQLTPHSLRHWFTVQLVINQEDIGGIQFWRGDRNPQSAFEYLQNKGDLVNELKEADERLASLLMKVGEQVYEK